MASREPAQRLRLVTASVAAGNRPAMNSALIDSVVMAPRTTIEVLGGTVSPMIADADRTAASRSRL